MQGVLESSSVPTEMIVVNDGSCDATAKILDQLQKTYPFLRAIHHEKNQMIGGAFLSGLAASEASHVLLIPVDNPLEKKVLQQFIEAADRADIVVGCRVQRSGYKLWMKILSRWYWLLCTVLFCARIQDWTWICLYDRKKILQLHLQFKGIALLPEILAKASLRKLVIAQMPCPMLARTAGKATVAKLTRIVHLFCETLKLWLHIRFQKW